MKHIYDVTNPKPNRLFVFFPSISCTLFSAPIFYQQLSLSFRSQRTHGIYMVYVLPDTPRCCKAQRAMQLPKRQYSLRKIQTQSYILVWLFWLLLIKLSNMKSFVNIYWQPTSTNNTPRFVLPYHLTRFYSLHMTGAQMFICLLSRCQNLSFIGTPAVVSYPAVFVDKCVPVDTSAHYHGTPHQLSYPPFL